MKHLRPIPSDEASSGWPVVAAKRPVEPAWKASRVPVTHSHATLAFFTGGQTRVEQRGEWLLREGDVLLVPAGEPHRTLEKVRSECWGLAFCVPCFAVDAGGAALLAPFERVRDGAAPVVHLPDARQGYVETLLGELEGLGHAPRSDGERVQTLQRSLLTLLLNEIDRATAAAPTKPASSLVTDSLRFIERNCLRRLTLDDVASAVGKSPAYVTSALKGATGRSVGEWILSGRMAEARRLLLHSDERVDVIAERVGYADGTHFIRMFRREHGATPAAWRAARTR